VADLTLDKLIRAEATTEPRTSEASFGFPSVAPAWRSVLGSIAPKRSTQRKLPQGREDEDERTAAIVALLRSTADWVVTTRGSSGSGSARV
jgi:hypothetical protein